MSLSPTIIVPLIAEDGKHFRVRTLLDSGCGTNWISRKVLQRIKHKVRAKNRLQVFTFNGAVVKSFPLVEIYFDDDKGKRRTIMCYVHEDYTTHVTVHGIVPHIRFNHTTPFSLSGEFADPNSVEVDHSDAATSIGMILCSATIATLRNDEPVIVLPELKIILEPTIFGIAISGSVPKELKSGSSSQLQSLSTPY